MIAAAGSSIHNVFLISVVLLLAALQILVVVGKVALAVVYCIEYF